MQFIGGERPDTRHVHVTYADNPWFTETPLEAEREYLQRVDDDAYRHVWLGECRRNTDAQVFAKKYTVEPFTVGDDWDGPYHGLDLGFKDPSVLTKCWVSGNRLYIEREAWQLNCDIDRLPALLDQVSGARDHVIRCDSARPETISYLKQHGYPDVVSVEKWPDSVEDGVARMRAFEMIVVHPDCVRTLDEMRLYSYKVDRLTGDVMPDIVDRHNHCIDSIRYGIAPLIKRAAGQGIIEYYQQQNAANAAAKASTSPAAEVAPQPARRPLFEIAARRGGIMRDI
jgi:phage terminase large subunit